MRREELVVYERVYKSPKVAPAGPYLSSILSVVFLFSPIGAILGMNDDWKIGAIKTDSM